MNYVKTVYSYLSSLFVTPKYEPVLRTKREDRVKEILTELGATVEDEKRILEMFKQIQEPFERILKITVPKRKAFLKLSIPKTPLETIVEEQHSDF